MERGLIMAKQHRYVPHLRWKLNERTALRELSSQGRDAVAPLVTLTIDQFKGGKPSKAKKPPKKGPLTAPQAFAKQVSDSWGTETMLLDGSDLAVGTSGSRHQLDDIGAAANALGLKLVPAAKLSAPPDYLNAVGRMHKVDKRGAALRIRLADMASAPSWLPGWKIPIQETDLIIDLRDGVADVAALGMPAQEAFAQLHQAKQWRSVTMAGGCIPETLTGYKIGATTIPRDEINFWRTLFAYGLPYRLDFGDYCSLSPEATTVSIPAPVPINAKYSLPDQFLIFHGVKIKGPGAVPMDGQLRKYAKAIVAHPRRTALSHCGGDNQIDRIAKTSAGETAGSPGSWVGHSVNRHIEITRDGLS